MVTLPVWGRDGQCIIYCDTQLSIIIVLWQF